MKRSYTTKKLDQTSLPPRRGRNPLDRYGRVTHCNVCYSINHWADDCPDKNYREEKKNNEKLTSVSFF